MTKIFKWIGLGLLIVWLLYASGIVAAALVFLLAGVVPGTRLSIPPVAMYVVLAILLVLVLYWLRRQKLSQQIRELKAKHQASSSSTKRPVKKKRAAPTRKKSSPAQARRSQPKAAAR